MDLGIAESQFQLEDVLAHCFQRVVFWRDCSYVLTPPDRPVPVGSGDVDGIKVLVENGADCSLRDNSLRTVMCNRATA